MSVVPGSAATGESAAGKSGVNFPDFCVAEEVDALSSSSFDELEDPEELEEDDEGEAS